MSRFSIIFALVFLSACSAMEERPVGQILNSNEIKQVENTPQALVNIADNLFEKEEYAASNMMYYKAYVKNEGIDKDIEIKAKMGRANSQLRLLQFQSAKDIFNELIENGYSSPQLQLGLAEASFGLREIDTAKFLVESLREDELNSAAIYTLKGVLSELELEHQQARKFYEKALSLRPNKTNNIVNLALSYALTDDFETSFALLKNINAEGQHMALIYALKGELDLAESTITKYFFRKGLGRAEVEQNIAFYKKLNELNKKDRVRAVVLGIIAN